LNNETISDPATVALFEASQNTTLLVTKVGITNDGFNQFRFNQNKSA